MRNLWGHCTSRVLCTSSVLGGPVGRVGLIPWVFMASLRSRDAVSPGMHPDEADNHLFECRKLGPSTRRLTVCTSPGTLFFASFGLLRKQGVSGWSF